jgi:hypothetical protein
MSRHREDKRTVRDQFVSRVPYRMLASTVAEEAGEPMAGGGEHGGAALAQLASILRTIPHRDVRLASFPCPTRAQRKNAVKSLRFHIIKSWLCLPYCRPIASDRVSSATHVHLNVMGGTWAKYLTVPVC